MPPAVAAAKAGQKEMAPVATRAPGPDQRHHPRHHYPDHRHGFPHGDQEQGDIGPTRVTAHPGVDPLEQVFHRRDCSGPRLCRCLDGELRQGLLRRPGSAEGPRRSGEVRGGEDPGDRQRSAAGHSVVRWRQPQPAKPQSATGRTARRAGTAVQDRRHTERPSPCPVSPSAHALSPRLPVRSQLRLWPGWATCRGTAARAHRLRRLVADALRPCPGGRAQPPAAALGPGPPALPGP